MNWIFIGVIAGNLVTSAHETREACEGRAVIAREQKVDRAKCVELAPTSIYITGSSGTIQLCNNCLAR